MFAAEAMYDIKEKEFRHIERIEEDMLRRIFKTGRGCAIYQLYLEAGQLPARFVIKKMKLIFLHYILSQREESLMFRFLMAQKNDPIRGDWYSDVIDILHEFELGRNEDDIKYIPVKTFKKIVKQKAEVAGLNYLLVQQKKCEKG